MNILDFFPMILDVKDSYRTQREKGQSREEAIKHIQAEYEKELHDADDRPQVLIGLADVLGRRKELTEDLLQAAESAFSELETAFPEARSALRAKKKAVCDTSKLGPEAKYRKKTIYRPDWKIGDTFAYRIRGRDMVEAGLEGWYIIARKGGEIHLSEDCCLQSMYFSVCPPDRLPTSAEELERLGYVPLLKITPDRYLFRGSVWVRSKTGEKKTYFDKIGCYPDIPGPVCEFDPELDPNATKDLYPMHVDGESFWYLEQAVKSGYTRHGIKPAQTKGNG